MKKYLSMIVAMVMVAMAGTLLAAGGSMSVATGGKLKACDFGEQAKWGATHVLELTAADLTLTNQDNTAMVFTNTIVAPFSLEFRGYVLDTAFDSATTNPGPYGITFSLGPSTASTKWLNALQVANDSTPTVYASLGTDYTVTVVDTNMAATVASPRLNAQTSDVKVLATVTPTSTNALSSLAVGKLRAYFRVIGKNYP